MHVTLPCLILLLFLTTLCTGTQNHRQHPKQSTIQDVNSYLKGRAKLESQEANMSLSGNVILSPQEKVANDILSRLLVKEAGIMGDYFAPSINFFDAHPWIDNTSILIDIVRQMPKGAVHHLLWDSAATYDYVLNATYWPTAYIYKGDPNLAFPDSIMFFANQPTNPGWISVNSLRQKSGNPQQFDTELLESWTLKGRDFGDYDSIWDKFGEIFQVLSTAFAYTELVKGHLQHIVSQMLADNIQQIELKINPDTVLYDLEGNTYDVQYMIDFGYELINATRKIEPSFSFKYIMCTLRQQNYTSLLPVLVKSLQLRNQNPDLVVGFDLAGPEDDGNTLLYFLDDFLQIKQISEKYKYDLPYYFHAGETLFPNNTNLYDAILLNTFRIGHAFQLSKHPLLMQMVKDLNIGLEICPISNQLLLYCPDLRNHPAYTYYSLDLPMSISPDDPAIYGYSGVSYDWYELLLAWNLDIGGLKQIALNSLLKGSFLTQGEQDNAITAWSKKWDHWIEWVIKNY